MVQIPYGDPLSDAPAGSTDIRFEAAGAFAKRLARRTLWACLVLLVVLAFVGAHDLDRRVRAERHDGDTWAELETWPVEAAPSDGSNVEPWFAPAESPESPPPRKAVEVDVEELAIVALRLRGLQLPVRGIDAADLIDSFGDSRSGGRSHRALDIHAPKGTPVLAVDDGKITSKATGNLGGHYLFQADETSSFVFYYAHLDGWSWGLEEGDRVRRGDVLGFVGTTGNAPADAPHLHFAIYKVALGSRGLGLPINPWRVFAPG